MEEKFSALWVGMINRYIIQYIIIKENYNYLWLLTNNGYLILSNLPDPTIFPNPVVGDMSPYPTEVIVIMAQYNAYSGKKMN